MNLTSLLLQDDLQAVMQLMGTYVHAWNEKDLSGFINCFSDTAEFTDSIGQTAHGLPAIQRLHEFPFVATGPLTVLHISDLYLRYLQKDLIIGTGNWTITGNQTQSGFDLPRRSGIIQVILTKNDTGAWKLILVHNCDHSLPSLKHTRELVEE